MTDVFVIDSLNYPFIFKAFELISHDCGREAGHLNYAVPHTYKDNLSRINYQLQKLFTEADLDFEILCIGDQEESQIIVKRLKLEEVDELLQRFFEEFR